MALDRATWWRSIPNPVIWSVTDCTTLEAKSLCECSGTANSYPTTPCGTRSLTKPFGSAARRCESMRNPTRTASYIRSPTAFSGLVVDRFGDVLSAEAFSLGMYQRAQAILDRLLPLCDARHTIIQTSPAFLSQEGYDPPTVTSEGFPRQVTITEHGTRFRVRFEGGHKTGFFCDQRENRERLAQFSEGKTVLDLCCYTGGFAVQAMKLGKAREVTGVDLDETPLQLAKENANLNQVRARFVQADAFAYMREMINNGRQYDVVILDPPKLIRTRTELDEGTKKHFALNCLAMRLVKPGGLLLSCSCAGLLQEQDFIQLLVAAARRAGGEIEGAAGSQQRYVARSMQILAKTGAAADHPVISNCLETEYLKAVWMVLR